MLSFAFFVEKYPNRRVSHSDGTNQYLLGENLTYLINHNLKHFHMNTEYPQ